MCRSGRLSPTGTLTFYLSCLIGCSALDYEFPIEIRLWDNGRDPLNHMVDVTNQFGLKVLAEHNFLNGDNIAFSPYGLTGILVALFEGVEGESSYQIRQAMQLPWSRDTMRIGFRDIHRTLKTYFVPDEGFLAGLALNNENITFTDQYKKILQFYGFDAEDNKNPDNSSITSTNETNGTLNPTMITDSPKSETISQTTSSTISKDDSDGSDLTTTTIETQTSIDDVDGTKQTSKDEITATTSQLIETKRSFEADEATTTAATMPSSLVELDDTPESPEPETTTATTSTTLDLTTSTDKVEETTAQVVERKKRSIVEFVYNHPPYVNDFLYRSYEVPDFASKTESDNMFLANGLRNVEVTYMEYNSVMDHAYLPHLEAAAIRLPLDSDRYYLLVVLPIRAGDVDLRRLIARMTKESDLRDVYEALRPRHVRATVPIFTVKGHIVLTTDLQKLGIREVFEPRQQDFIPMTSQAGVYVRSIEQAVSVTIQKYQPDDMSTSYTRYQPPVHFPATYPFLYFVMDSTINVCLMAGKMVDPLNSRIL